MEINLGRRLMCEQRASDTYLEYELEDEAHDISVPAMCKKLSFVAMSRALLSTVVLLDSTRSAEPHLVLNNRMIISQKVCRRP